MPKAPAKHTIREHFVGRAPEVAATYAAILKAARKCGPVREEPKKTSIHLMRKTAFAGVATRKTALILTLKSPADLQRHRIVRREHASANRWHLEVRLDAPDQVDRELVTWLAQAYELAG
jgi:predicted DNA-binding protein (MmcQ/YjbR family)